MAARVEGEGEVEEDICCSTEEYEPDKDRGVYPYKFEPVRPANSDSSSQPSPSYVT